MALIQCPDCHRQVSSSAPSCPNCGALIAARHVKRPTNPWMIIGWIILAVLVLPLVTCVAIFGGSRINAGVGRGEANLERSKAQTVSIAPVEQLYAGYLAAKSGGHQSTADNYADLIRQHYPDSAQRAEIDGLKK